MMVFGYAIFLPLMLKNLTFDQIWYNEHVMYYTFGVFEKILLYSII